jgi:hypothetical protein
VRAAPIFNKSNIDWAKSGQVDYISFLPQVRAASIFNKSTIDWAKSAHVDYIFFSEVVVSSIVTDLMKSS